ncbi:MAG TPA: cell division protein FtsZ [Ktedonobacteraceae bacterium]|nr:cell division protein FtsZ [Ktedonobacteraceae bacterium]
MRIYPEALLPWYHSRTKKDEKKWGFRMQSMSHERRQNREISPDQRQRTGMAKPVNPEVPEAQEDQWAVLRHEVEVEDMGMGQEAERIRPGWQPRDTEDDALSPQSSFEETVDQSQHHVDIVVAGVGGAGMNAVGRMINAHVRGVRFVAMNTDAQVLALSEAPDRICLGANYTKGLGAGGISAVGNRAANESMPEIRASFEGANLVFIAAGMGGGTGTGAAPVVASIAKKMGALTIGIVTLPFTFEGTRRRRAAEEGLAELRNAVDALITVPNDRLLSITGKDRSLSDAFKLADDVLRQGVQGIAEVINVPGLVNVDFADVRSVLRESGTALMSIGQGEGSDRAQRAAQQAIDGGFLNVAIRGAKRILFNISGGEDMTLFEVNEVAEKIGQAVDSAADITFGAVIDPSLDDTIRVTLIAAGMENVHLTQAARMSANRTATTDHTLQRASLPPNPNRATMQIPAVPPLPRTPQPVTPRPGTVRPTPRYNEIEQEPEPRRVGQNPPAHVIRPPRNQRSLNDLRGLRSLGRRQENQTDTDGEQEEVDMPSFLKKFN